MTDKMRYASVNNPVISALVNQAYKFPTLEAALKLLETIKKQFILAKGHAETLGDGKIRLWIRGYRLSASEVEDGALGNFCNITIDKKHDGSCVLLCVKEEVKPANHPLKKRKTASMPNWGHPILKAIKKDGKFEKYEDAVEALYNLHQEFPATTIPNTDRLDLMVYTREGKNAPQTKKILLTIAKSEDGAYIKIEEKTPKPKPAAEPAEPKEIKGKFTAAAVMRKAKKKRK